MQERPFKLLVLLLVLSASLLPVLAKHPYDDPNEAAEILLGEVYLGTSREATGEALSHCGYRDIHDVWHRYTATQDGLLNIELTSSTFDSILGVFDPCSMAELACSDMTCYFGLPKVMMPVTAGTSLLIRVAGYARTSGNFELLISRVMSDALTSPLQAFPADLAGGIRTSTELRWDGTVPDLAVEPAYPVMDRAVVTATSVIKVSTIYDTDDREDEYEVGEPNRLAAGQAVAMIMVPENFLDNGDGTVTLFSGTLGEEHALLTGRLLCPEERFREQPAPGSATGFLVAPQILATAGHVVACGDTFGLDEVVVFDFVMADTNTPAIIVQAENIYAMDRVLAYNDGLPDWALVQLDRAVTDRMPLPLRRLGRLADDVNDLLVIGHPLGLPRKYSGHGKVLGNDEPSFFETDLDVNGGNSGSPVLHPDTLEVEGILFAGNEDFVPGEPYEGRCDRSLICPDEQGRCDGWEWVTRATHFSQVIPVFDVFLGLDPNALVQVASRLNVSYFMPENLQANRVHFWQVQAHTVEGSIMSSVWSFTTSDEQKRLAPQRTSLKD